ncbi:trehalose-phosphatase [Polaromonas sp.]|uniref:trehalose-phosphatase n=1 Tax=Polaromonas sp. TaxID=1869339 RepID=UPI002732FCE5|nr:trehalose-phosphatase [Polaromonas sp.]
MPQEMLPRITSRTALFLDFDGTLVEIAPRPDAVIIPSTLTSTLAALYGQLDGALALVSGRRLLDLDGFLAPLQLPVAVEHGAQRRNAQGQMISAPATDLRHVLAAADNLLLQHPALKLEHKNLALSLHYRHAPELEALCLQVMQAAVAKSSGLQLMQGKCVIDLKLSGFSKGTAIAAFMAEAPFAGRVPVFAGDDVTDEDGFEEVQRMGGHAVKVGAGPTSALHRCAGVPAMAAWLQSALVPSLASRAESLPS